MSTQKPTVGRIVHYYAESNGPDDPHSGPFAALVVAIGPTPDEGKPQTVDLAVWFSGERTHAKTNVPESDEATKHCWSWPPRA